MSNEIINQVKGVIVSLATKKLLAILVSRFAFFSLGPVNWVAGLVVNYIVKKLVEETFIGATMAYIELDTSADAKEVRKVLDEVRQMPKEKMTPEKVTELDKRLADAWVGLIRYGTINRT